MEAKKISPPELLRWLDQIDGLMERCTLIIAVAQTIAATKSPDDLREKLKEFIGPYLGLVVQVIDLAGCELTKSNPAIDEYLEINVRQRLLTLIQIQKAFTSLPLIEVQPARELVVTMANQKKACPLGKNEEYVNLLVASLVVRIKEATRQKTK
jgi:hypothetical protein